MGHFIPISMVFAAQYPHIFENTSLHAMHMSLNTVLGEDSLSVPQFRHTPSIQQFSGPKHNPDSSDRVYVQKLVQVVQPSNDRGLKRDYGQQSDTPTYNRLVNPMLHRHNPLPQSTQHQVNGQSSFRQEHTNAYPVHGQLKSANSDRDTSYQLQRNSINFGNQRPSLESTQSNGGIQNYRTDNRVPTNVTNPRSHVNPMTPYIRDPRVENEQNFVSNKIAGYTPYNQQNQHHNYPVFNHSDSQAINFQSSSQMQFQQAASTLRGRLSNSSQNLHSHSPRIMSESNSGLKGLVSESGYQNGVRHQNAIRESLEMNSDRIAIESRESILDGRTTGYNLMNRSDVFELCIYY